MNNEIEIPFNSGESANVVVKVGNTVRRSLGENSERVHKIYKALEAGGFDLSPRFLGIDNKNREIITFIDGTNATEGNIDIAIEAIKSLRKFHDILSATELKEDQETICHRDFAPWNVLISNDHIVGIIDFDDAYPGKRITDIAYACWTFLKLGDDSSSKTSEEQVNLIKLLLDTYREVDKSQFIKELISEQTRILNYRQDRINEATTVAEKKEREQKYSEIIEQINWIKRNTELMEDILKNN